MLDVLLISSTPLSNADTIKVNCNAAAEDLENKPIVSPFFRLSSYSFLSP